jgi:hypothetical protein
LCRNGGHRYPENPQRAANPDSDVVERAPGRHDGRPLVRGQLIDIERPSMPLIDNNFSNEPGPVSIRQ